MGKEFLMGTRNTRLKAMFITLLKAILPQDTTTTRPPVEAEAYSFMEYLRIIIEHETSTHESCDNAVRHILDAGAMPPDTGEWERYFIHLRIVAAMTFLAECGGNDEEGEESGISVKLPKNNGDAFRLLLCDHWDRHFCWFHVRLDAVSKYFKGSSAL
jgi:hypothetical protein